MYHLQALPPLVHIDIRIVYDVNPDPLRTSSLIEFFQGRTAEMFLQKQMEPLQIAEIHQVIINVYQGRESLQMIMQDYSPA